jgi:hypothetical protein
MLLCLGPVHVPMPLIAGEFANLALLQEVKHWSGKLVLRDGEICANGYAMWE